jgi:hypothetical protein
MRMWVAVTFAAIGLTGAAFMVWFLLALLCEGALSACYRLAPVRREEAKGSLLKELSCIYVDDASHAPECKRSEHYVKLLENEGYAKECVSGLTALGVRPVPARLGWRSSHARAGYSFRQGRF